MHQLHSNMYTVVNFNVRLAIMTTNNNHNYEENP